MAYARIPTNDAVLLTRLLGMLFSQAGIYGPGHAVTQGATRSAFIELSRALKSHGPLEFVATENQILLNGTGEGLGLAVGKNLYDRMRLYKVGGILFTPPPDEGEFAFCVGLFGTPPMQLEARGGFEAVLKAADPRSVRVVSVAYQRVSGDEPAAAPDPEKSLYMSAEPVAARPLEAQPPKPARPGVIDLSAALAGMAPVGSRASAEDEPRPVASAGSAAAASRRERAAALAAMFRNAAELLERGLASGQPATQQDVGAVLDGIRGALADMTAGSRRDISALASEVEEDSKTIASIESAARRRGIGLKLTRQDLIHRYAELNQEIVQPLTVSSGVIDLLHSEKAGGLNESQRGLLRMAAESVERVNQLVAYLNRVSGLPESLTPDSAVINETYR